VNEVKKDVKNILMWDVDTQVDFMTPGGKLYIPGAEEIVDNLRIITNTANAKHYKMAGSVDAHVPDDPEFRLYPEHCVYGTPGQLKIPETLVGYQLFVPSTKINAGQVELSRFDGQVLFEKQTPSCKMNQNLRFFLDVLHPDDVFIYGVASDICVAEAMQYIAGERCFNTYVITDAIKGLSKDKEKELMENWKTWGNVEFIKTYDFHTKF
jgi:nicotinamidase/pyrazinamidase